MWIIKSISFLLRYQHVSLLSSRFWFWSKHTMHSNPSCGVSRKDQRPLCMQGYQVIIHWKTICQATTYAPNYSWRRLLTLSLPGLHQKFSLPSTKQLSYYSGEFSIGSTCNPLNDIFLHSHHLMHACYNIDIWKFCLSGHPWEFKG